MKDRPCGGLFCMMHGYGKRVATGWENDGRCVILSIYDNK